MKPAIVGGSVGGAVALMFVGWCIISCLKWTRSTSHDFLARTGGARWFEYCVLAAATDNFSEQKIIGQGAFGVVYRGKLAKGSSSGVPSRELDSLPSKVSADDTEVAVKKILKEVRRGNLDFFAEINAISQAKHKNLVKVKGWCRRENNQNLLDFMCWCGRKKKDDEVFLVYELVPNRDLDYHLFKCDQVLSWPKRYQIVKYIGSALVYLHRDCHRPILHRDIKPGNVLLDNGFKAKLADFGLSRIGNKNNAAIMTTAIGTLRYMDPECMNDGKVELHPRSDVYSFGIVLLDIICTGKSRLEVWELYQGGKVIEAVDEKLHGDDFATWQTQMQRVAVLGLWCSLLDGAKRPTVQKAMEFLERDEPLPNLNYAMNNRLPLAYHDAYTSHCSDEQTLMSDAVGGRTGKKAAATPKNKPDPAATTAATPTTRKLDGSAGRGSSKSPVQSKMPDHATSLSARLGSMVLMDKEANGITFDDPEDVRPKFSRWVAVGKACTTRPMNKTVLERPMLRAWGLHKEAKFRVLGGNIFRCNSAVKVTGSMPGIMARGSMISMF
ncbi:L-type lectin-domain containing receptor kinase IX.1-like [Triticum aestivum]|uniref:L-type lectin-domain containing receptor kinase IX.1-like n=1 Tax=Triticum aestivum TaxID=4565 RepID=UPI001D026881|nr:L-type lectin-domain containing receptor kinase IX.1-like [Triticum aestivum]